MRAADKTGHAADTLLNRREVAKLLREAVREHPRIVQALGRSQIRLPL